MSESKFGLPSQLPYKIITVIVALAFLFFGGMKMMSPDQLLQNFQSWGYPAGSHYVVGALEIFGAIGLLFIPHARKAAILLAMLMVGAMGTHVLHPPLSAGITSLVLFVLCVALIFKK